MLIKLFTLVSIGIMVKHFNKNKLLTNFFDRVR